MNESKWLESLEDLNGKVAIVTGGSQGIGLETTILLARLGATVYICALGTPGSNSGRISASEQLIPYPNAGTVHFHELDLGSIGSARKSAEELKKKIQEGDIAERRVDIIVGNAGVAFTPLDVLSPDGYERTWAVNCLGHFVFIKTLMDLVQKTADQYGEARITLTSSEGYKLAKKLDYKALTTRVPEDGKHYKDVPAGFQRYVDSKLAVLYLVFEMNKRIRARGVTNVYINACHPGDVPRTELGCNQQPLVSPLMAKVIKGALAVVMRHSAADATKTQVWLSASRDVREKDIKGQYWEPMWSWKQTYVRSKKGPVNTLAGDEGEWKKLWQFCEEAVAKAGGDNIEA